MRKQAMAILLSAFCLAALWAAPAQAEFGFKNLEVTITDSFGSDAMRAGSHPLAVTTTLAVNTREEGSKLFPEGQVKDLVIEAPPGLAGTPTPVPRCTAAQFLDTSGSLPACSDASAVGFVKVTLGFEGPASNTFPLYLLEPAPGVAGKLGFIAISGIPVTIDLGVNPNPPYNVLGKVSNIAQAAFFYDSETTIWGNPASSAHDEDRGRCLVNDKSCPANIPVVPFLTLPRACTGPLVTVFAMDPWENPGAWVFGKAETPKDALPPNPPGVTGCANLGFAPEVSSEPTTNSTESPTGLDFNIDINDAGLTNPDGIAKSDIQKVVVTLPQGVTANASIAEGLATCSEADLAREEVDSEPGEGCPQASKIGTVEVLTPLLEGTTLHGQVFIATQNKNPFGTLLAFYIVIREPKLGVIVKVPAKVEPDPKTGQLVTTVDDIPQFPFSHFNFHFREGGRAPLVTPPLCGSAYETEAIFTPRANPSQPLPTTATFEIDSGVGGGPCPPGGTPPFAPGLTAGTVNNAAGQYSPFYARFTRRDGDQDLTKFSVSLPPGLIGKLAGIGRCSDAAIAAAKTKSGRDELASPSCPASSQVGHVLAGAGTGSELTYVPGKVYLAGPYNGSLLSIVEIVPAVAGPFDVGTVVVRQGIVVDPRRAQVRIDGDRSDPVPHILAGIPLKVRDIRAYIDRPQFTLNPTSCDPFSIGTQLWGGGSNVFSVDDDAPLSLATHFQAANCQNLDFKPRLSLQLKGGTRRGAHPALHSVYKPRSGDANLKGLVLRLPRSAFLDQGHIRTICTRVAFAAKACPPESIYGHATAHTPILDEPLSGPIYLRSSNHNLPDLVFDLHGLVDFEAVARIDSQRGGIRATFEDLPDAPVKEVTVDMPAGRKGLIVNSTNLCARKHRADARLDAQSNKQSNTKPVVRPSCKKPRGR